MKSFRRLALSAAICVAATFGTVIAIRGFSYVVNIYEDFRGYDYDAKIAKQYAWIGPNPGEVIDVTKLQDTDGSTLDQLSNTDLILLTVVDPECAAAKESEEQMRFLDESLKQKGVDYFLAYFSRKISPGNLSEYTNSLTVDAKPLSWADDFENVLPSIKAIVYPSHILIDSKGRVIKTFPGTSNDRAVRFRMVRQVLKEVMMHNQKSALQP
ncbi:MAG: hypothetical protein DMF63_09620 [Acidobacteria bacterium]|nr:MAG: hypothetical protein DMF63_09620 [Acidobacteriota bacterium]